MSINIRISDVCGLRKIKQSELVSEGFGSKQTVSFIFNEKQKPNPLFLEKFLRKFTNVDARWLITGEGDMFKEKAIDSENINGLISSYTTTCNNCRDKEVENRLLRKQANEKDEKIYELQKAVGVLEEKLRGDNNQDRNENIEATG